MTWNAIIAIGANPDSYRDCEHPFAWMGAYKALLVKYEKLDNTWVAMNLMGMMHIFFRKIQHRIKYNLKI